VCAGHKVGDASGSLVRFDRLDPISIASRLVSRAANRRKHSPTCPPPLGSSVRRCTTL